MEPVETSQETSVDVPQSREVNEEERVRDGTESTAERTDKTASEAKDGTASPKSPNSRDDVLEQGAEAAPSWSLPSGIGRKTGAGASE